jgi:hypothetical protein
MQAVKTHAMDERVFGRLRTTEAQSEDQAIAQWHALHEEPAG